MEMSAFKAPGIPVSSAARHANMSKHGLMKLLRRVGKLVELDGHLYVDPEDLRKIIDARAELGIKPRVTEPEGAAA